MSRIETGQRNHVPRQSTLLACALLAIGVLLTACGEAKPSDRDSVAAGSTASIDQASGRTGSTAVVDTCVWLSQVAQIDQARSERESESPFVLSNLEMLDFQRQLLVPLGELESRGDDELRSAAARARDDLERQVTAIEIGDLQAIEAALEESGSDESIADYMTIVRYAEKCGLVMDGP